MTAADQQRIGALMDAHGACVVIPTYNNARTLADVLKGAVALAGHRVIVVNDGSTDGTSDILAGLPAERTVQHAHNQGKGQALRDGFALARRSGFRYAITIDSDGQHDPADIPAMLEALAKRPGSMIIGARDMSRADVPGRSSFGNRFSNFWFRVCTGLRLPDTQTGFRAYPLEGVSGIRVRSGRFAFELESLVKLAWAGTPFQTVPVRVRYDMPDRVSHFRPFVDFMRISLLNTRLVTVAMLWFWPRQLFVKGGLVRLLRAEAVRPWESPWRKAVSIGFGLFMGIVPIWGFQLAVGVPLAYLFKLNRVLVIAAANISVPPMIPLIVFASYLAGAPFMGGEAWHPGDLDDLTFARAGEYLAQYVVGAIALAVAAGLGGTLVAFLTLKLVRRKEAPTA